MKSYPRLVCCEHCDSLFLRERLRPHELARCTRCETPLYRHHGFSMQALVAMALASGLLFLLANAAPLFTVSLRGDVREVRLWDTVTALADGPAFWAAPLAAWCFVVVPMTQVVLLNWVFAWASRRERAPGFGAALRVLHALRPWSMCEVVLLGAMVAGIKLTGWLDVTPQPGLLALAMLTIVLLVLGHRDINVLWDVTRPGSAPSPRPSSLRRRGPWARSLRTQAAHVLHAGAVEGTTPRAIDLNLRACHDCGLVCAPDAPHSDVAADVAAEVAADVATNVAADVAKDAAAPTAPAAATPRCPRCHAKLHARKPMANPLAWALLLSATILYVPANLVPVLFTTTFGSTDGSTIVAGVLDFYASGHRDIAIIIFVASVLVPCTKFLVLGFLLLGAGRATPTGRRDRTRLLRLLEFIGYWSMLDVIVVGLVVAAVQYGVVTGAAPGVGIAYFAASVILTMLAVMQFDPRAIWDAPSESTRESSPASTRATEGLAAPQSNA